MATDGVLAPHPGLPSSQCCTASQPTPGNGDRPRPGGLLAVEAHTSEPSAGATALPGRPSVAAGRLLPSLSLWLRQPHSQLRRTLGEPTTSN